MVIIYLEKNEVAKGKSEWKERPAILNRVIRKGLTSEASILSLSDLKILLSQNQNKEEKEPIQTPDQPLPSICSSNQCLNRFSVGFGAPNMPSLPLFLFS